MTEYKNKSGLRRRVVEMGMVVVGIILALAFFEGALRVAGIGYRVDHNWSYHPTFGWTQVPAAQYTYQLDGEELQVQFNAAGFRDLEHAADKPPGVRRIAIIGDSFSESVQVALEQTYFRRLERELNREGARWEVLNFGVGDYGTAQQALVLRDVVLAYEPDIVVHQIFPLNDICNNNRTLYGLCKSDNDPYRPYGVLEDGQLEFVYPQPVRKWLREHVRTWFVLERAAARLSRRWRAEDYWAKRIAAAGYGDLEPLLYTFVPDPPPDRGLEEGWQVTEALIERIVADTRRAGARYLALVVPFEARVAPNRWRAFVAGLGPAGARMERAYPEMRLGQLFDRLDVSAVLLRPLFERHRQAVLPYREGHLNPEGHRVTAEALARAIAGFRNGDPDRGPAREVE